MYLPIIKEELQRYRLEYKYKLNVNDEGLVRFTIPTNWAKNPDDNINFRYLLDLIIKNYDELTQKINGGKNKITFKRRSASSFIAELWNKVQKDKSLYKVLLEESQSNEFLKELRSSLLNFKKLIENRGTKKAGLLDFLNISGLFVAPGKTPLKLVSEINEWKNELIGSNRPSSYEPIMIYNMPSSKGLEADVIFIVGLSEELFPRPDDDFEEKSRLFYVAMTRAKKELYLFSSRTRSSKITFKKDSYQLKPSPFINTIYKDHIDVKKIFPASFKK
jgi:superfamily I DNA/RNA helicase